MLCIKTFYYSIQSYFECSPCYKSTHTNKQFSKPSLAIGSEIRKINENNFKETLLSTHVHENVV